MDINTKKLYNKYINVFIYTEKRYYQLMHNKMQTYLERSDERS